MKDDKELGCPFCGAEETPENPAGWTFWNCGSYVDDKGRFFETVACLRRQLAQAKSDLEMANGCLNMIAERLEQIGCGHDDARASTPPMNYDDWISCVVAHQTKQAKEQIAAEALAKGETDERRKET
ncbi:MAG: hypothetical protein KAV00_06935 [Phycisphaerae bacterium]|nr:hypothetical protein [Phycisphaerae bacterium]